MKEISVEPINTRTSFKEVCLKYVDQGMELPISGGWGFTKEEAIIIENHKSSDKEEVFFNKYALEFELIEKRNQIEFHHHQNNEHQYRDIHWEVEKQELIEDKDRFYDKLTIKISALHIDDYRARHTEWKVNGRKPDFDKEWFMNKSKELTQHCQREFWFDITDVFLNP